MENRENCLLSRYINREEADIQDEGGCKMFRLRASGGGEITHTQEKYGE